MAAEQKDDNIDWDADLESSLNNIIEQTTLKWIFVGGKGGVGKTTTSCSLAAALTKTRSKVLLVSTDPAHNLSDAFGQKFGKKATPVNDFPGLSAMEIDPTVEVDTGDVLDDGSKGILSELASSIPGIDEAMSFAELMKQVSSMDYDTIVFDTAPTGHTLRLLSFPSVIEKGFEKLMEMKEKFSGMFSQMSSVMGGTAGGKKIPTEDELLVKLEKARNTIDSVNKQFQNPDATTFVCVCIPEFLSLFETERLVQELSKYGIDSHNIVVNHVLVPDADSTCKKCNSRVKMQQKYLNQVYDLYDDFNVTVMPLRDEEVRGKEALASFGHQLTSPDAQPDVSHISNRGGSSGI